MLKLATAMAVMGVALWFGVGAESNWLQYGMSERVLRLAGLVCLGGGAYFATLWILGFRLGDFKRRAAE
jgi:putative peptidoglycan lipid II flippase